MIHKKQLCIEHIFIIKTSIKTKTLAVDKKVIITFILGFKKRAYDSTAVSYTHLDVYKRQELNIFFNYLLFSCLIQLWCFCLFIFE